MKQIFFAMFAAATLLLGVTGCSTEDNSSAIDINALEQSLVGLWWDEFEYSDVTDEGEPFSSVLLAVKFETDHTGCIYLAVFNDTSELLAVYGGPREAGFTWCVLSDGRLLLSDLITDESDALTRSGDGGGSYGDDMTDVSNTSMSYTDDGMTVTNGSSSNKLAKADAEKEAEIVEMLSKLLTNTNLSNVDDINISDTDAGTGFWGR